MAQVFHSFYVEGSPHAYHWIIHESVDGSGEQWRDIVRSPRTYRTWWEAHEEGGHALLHCSEGGTPVEELARYKLPRVQKRYGC